MKKYTKIFIGFLLLFVLTGCTLAQKENINVSEIEGISMTIKKDTLKNTSATIIITDTTGKENTFDSFFKIEKKKEESWQEVKTIIANYGFNDMGYKVGENHMLEMSMNWENLYGSLDAGTYRLIKSVSMPEEEKKYFAVEFTIE